jgi:hypothetical protein
MSLELDISYPGSATLYAIIRRASDGYVWNGTAFVVWADLSIADYDVALTSQGGDYYAVDFPALITTAGTYRIFYYVQAGATPATSDLLLDNESLYWTGSAVGAAPSGSNLTTLARVKEYLGIEDSDTTHDAKLTNLLAAASRYIESYCDNIFTASTYTEYHSGRGAGWLSTRNTPISAITRVATEPATVLTIANTDTTNKRAYVSVGSTSVSWVRTPAAGSIAATAAFVTYPTLGDLADYFNALGGGWVATVAAEDEDRLTSDLRSIQHVSAMGDGAELEMHVEELSLSRIDETTGTIWGRFPYGFQNIEVKYTAGYSSIPDDVQAACAALAASMFNISESGGGGGGVKREKIGDYEIERFDTTSTTTTTSISSLSTDAFMLLQPYKRIPAL